MRYELFVSLRYLRAKRRDAFISFITLIATVGVAIGVMTLNIVLSVMTGFEEDLRDRILGFTPHVLVLNDLGGIEAYPAVLERLRHIPGVAAATAFVHGQSMLSTPENVAGVLVRGIPPITDESTPLPGHLDRSVVEQLDHQHAASVNSGGNASVRLPGIILGTELALELGVAVGDPVNVALPFGRSAVAGVPRIKRFVVVGEFESGMPEYDSGFAYVSLGDAQRLYQLGAAVTGLEIRATELYQASAVAGRIAETLGPPYRVLDWMETNRNLFWTLKVQKTVYFIVLLLIILVAAFTILATLIMVVMEKRKDIAVLKSMGAPREAIGRIFVFKGLIIGAVGTLCGNIGGYVGCLAIERYQFVELPKDVFYVSTVPVAVYPEYFAAVTVASLVICLLATIYPARQAARLVPVDILRYE